MVVNPKSHSSGLGMSKDKSSICQNNEKYGSSRLVRRNKFLSRHLKAFKVKSH